MSSVSWVEIREPLAEHLVGTLDFLRQLDVMRELRQFAEVVGAIAVDANVVAAVALYGFRSYDSEGGGDAEDFWRFSAGLCGCSSFW